MEYIASISYGKDSLAMLEVIHRYSLPLDRIVHVEIMATDTIHADLPPMVAFKEKADKIIYKKYGIRVEHISSPKSYEDYFYSVSNGEKSLYAGKIYGFPMQKGNWCTGRLKQSVLQKVQRNAIVYIGIAIDEPKRFHNLTESKRSPLVEYGWTEKMCRELCEENGLLSPTYETSLRGGCWFCHNQSTAQLRLLRKQYPKLWAKLLAWDLDSPISFKGNGRTVHDYERRFQLEEQAKVPMDRTFRWGMMEDKSMIKHIYTAESVTCGHPDKLADLIADIILDACLEQDEDSNSFYQVLSAESYTKHGLNVHGVIFDELHAQPNRALYDVMLHGSGDARKQPLFFLITTAGTDRNSICWEVHSKAKDIIEGRKHDKSFYPVIYGAEDDDDWGDEKVWYKANPSLGVTVDIDKLKTAFNSAKENPAEENLFRQLRLNQWVKQNVRWMPMDAWDKCDFAVNAEKLLGRECYGGLDLSSSTDITAFVLVFPPTADDDKYSILPYFWIPEDTIDLRVRRDHVPYDTWLGRGQVIATEGNVIHYGYIENFIEDLGTKYHIKEIAFDRWGAVQMVQNLEGMGFTVVPFGQGFKDMSPPTKELMKLVLEQKIAHGGNVPLRWMMDNVYVRTDPAGNIKMDKEKSTERIDGAVATVMALDRAIRNEGSTDSVYNERGIIVI